MATKQEWLIRIHGSKALDEEFVQQLRDYMTTFNCDLRQASMDFITIYPSLPKTPGVVGTLGAVVATTAEKIGTMWSEKQNVAKQRAEEAAEEEKIKKTLDLVAKGKKPDLYEDLK